MPEFQPYGKEWEAEMMKFKKVDVIKILRGAIFGKIYEINAAMEAGKILRQQRDEAYAEIARLKAYNQKLLDENITLLNERNEARRKLKSMQKQALDATGISSESEKGKVTP